MKNLKILASLLAIMLFISCNSDDDKNAQPTLKGEWKLIEVNGTIAGINDEFEPGVITWNFNPQTETFAVVNNNTDESKQDVFDTGTYSYDIVPATATNSTCGQTIELDDVDYGCFIITNTTLQINQGEADGIILKLIR